ncbi:hypothetical protein [Morganella morganii]|uniref:hypothetical protein n=1 Tax=Morganella morganii TaxID=582 RepID=UPI001FFC9D57|nr:hypothetical protein [Morganella morganii]
MDKLGRTLTGELRYSSRFGGHWAVGKNVTLSLNTLQNEACLTADYWLSLSEKGFPGDTACCADSEAVLHQLKETIIPETRCVLLMVLTDPAQSGEKLMSLTSALEMEIA